jgi:hypothetical protein
MVCVFEDGDWGGGDVGEIGGLFDRLWTETVMSENQPEKFWFTVEQLIEILKTLPPGLPVLVSGQKSGFENFYHPFVVKMKHEPENWYTDGEFQVAKDGEKELFDAVVLARVVRDD